MGPLQEQMWKASVFHNFSCILVSPLGDLAILTGKICTFIKFPLPQWWGWQKEQGSTCLHPAGLEVGPAARWNLDRAKLSPTLPAWSGAAREEVAKGKCGVLLCNGWPGSEQLVEEAWAWWPIASLCAGSACSSSSFLSKCLPSTD